MILYDVAQITLGELQRDEFRHGFYAAAFSSASSAIPMPNQNIRFAAATVIGGTAASLGGGKFANGAITGAFVYLYNQALEKASKKYRIENHDELNDKKAVGAFITDDNVFNSMGSDSDKKIFNWKDKWKSGIQELNKRLAADGVAIEIAIVDNRDGYYDYINDRLDSSIKYPYIAFHGSGSNTNEMVRINNSPHWTVKNYTDEKGVERMGFYAFTEKAFKSFTPAYYNPQSQRYDRVVPIEYFKGKFFRACYALIDM